MARGIPEGTELPGSRPGRAGAAAGKAVGTGKGRGAPARGRPQPRCRCSDPRGPFSTGFRLRNQRGTGIPMGRGIEAQVAPSTPFMASCPPSTPELAPGHTLQGVPLLPRVRTRGSFRKPKAGHKRKGKPHYRSTLLVKGQTNPGSAYFSCFAFSWMALSTPGYAGGTPCWSLHVARCR